MLKKIINLPNATLLTAMCLSTVAAWFAIAGLVAIFPAKAQSIIVMGAIIEVAKIVATIWLRKYWSVAGWPFKALLIPMVVIAMALTSMGTFGYLSGAHSEQSSVSGDIVDRVATIDEKIKTQRDNIELARKALQQMDDQVNQRLSRSDSETGAERAVFIRRQQSVERAKIQREISEAQTAIAKLNEERAPFAAQLRKVEAEVGPVKYIAALVYGDNPDANTLERAVRWVIIMLVLVFDPFAIALVLAGNASKQWRLPEDSQDSTQKIVEPEESPSNNDASTIVENTLIENLDSTATKQEKDNWAERIAAVENSTPWPTAWVSSQAETNSEESKKDEDRFDLSKHSYLFSGGFGFKDSGALVAEKSPAEPALPTITDAIIEPEIVAPSSIPTPAPKPQDDQFALRADNSPREISTSFGTQFPRNPIRGDIFVRTDVMPHTVHKWDGSVWMNVQKKSSDSYLYDVEYIQYLIEKVGGGEYDVELLSDAEKDQIRAYLREINSKNNILGDDSTQ